MFPNKKSFISLMALITLSMLLLLGLYFISFVLLEFNIVQSYTKASQTYYLAEAGVNEAIWKIKNDDTTEDGDPAWETDFVTSPNCENFNTSFTRTNVLYDNSSYTVSIQNTECARGEIIATASIVLPNGNTTQRVIKTKVFKAQNASPIENSAVFTGGPSEVISFMAGQMNVYNGNLFSNNNLLLQLASDLNVYDDAATPTEEGKVLVVNNINKSILSTIAATGKCSRNICEGNCPKCPPDSVSMPMIDFDSANENSYKSRAEVLDTVYTSTEFEDLLWNNQNLTLNNEVTYVTGPIELRGGQTLTVNGALVTDGTITIGERYCWVKGLSARCGNSKITVNHSVGVPSGVMTKDKFNVSIYTQRIDITGLLYVNDQFKLVSLPQSFNIVGGMLARKMSFTSIWQALNVTLNNDLINEAIGTPTYSPVVQVDHWEETY